MDGGTTREAWPGTDAPEFSEARELGVSISDQKADIETKLKVQPDELSHEERGSQRVIR